MCFSPSACCAAALVVFAGTWRIYLATLCCCIAISFRLEDFNSCTSEPYKIPGIAHVVKRHLAKSIGSGDFEASEIVLPLYIDDFFTQVSENFSLKNFDGLISNSAPRHLNSSTSSRGITSPTLPSFRSLPEMSFDFLKFTDIPIFVHSSTQIPIACLHDLLSSPIIARSSTKVIMVTAVWPSCIPFFDACTLYYQKGSSLVHSKLSEF